MKKKRFFFYKFILSFLLLISLIILINFYIDPFAYFDNKKNIYEKNISKNLSKNKPVLIKSDWQDQILKYFLLQNSDFEEHIIIGSSRSYAINKKIMNKKIKNYSLSSAGVNEIISFIDLSLENKKIKKITISIDPWIFDESYNKLIPIFFKNYVNALKKIDDNANVIEILKNYKRQLTYVLQPYVLFRSFLDIIYKITDKQFYLKSEILKENNSITSDGHIINPDGSLIYPEKILVATDSEISKNIFKEMNNYHDLGFNFSEKKINTFKKYLNYLTHNEIEIELLMIPLHPLAFKTIKNRTNDFFISENILKREFKSNVNVRLLGSFNPSNTECQFQDFLDSHHPRLSCIKKLYTMPGS